MNTRHILLCLALSLLGAGLQAQTFQPLSPYGNITPSVETFTMTRYGSLVPSLYTGAMTFSVPVYTYSDPDFTIPVSLEYNYDGYKPSQHSGLVGLGWSLKCGGVITREIRGVPDEGTIDNSIKGWKAARAAGIQYLYETANNICSTAMVGCLVNVSGFPYLDECVRNAIRFDAYHDSPMYAVSGQHLYYDTAPDLFHFEFCGYSGDFMILDDGTIRAYNANVPQGELSITFTPGDGLLETTDIVIKTADGTKYHFGGSWENLESAHSRPCGQETLSAVYGLGFSMGLGLSANDITSTTVTAFHLYKITAPNGRTVQFKRRIGRLWEIFLSPDYINKGNARPEHKETLISNTCVSPLDSVTVDGKTILFFSYETRTFDEDNAQYFLSDEIRDDSSFQGLDFRHMDRRFGPAKRLSGIEVKNTSGELAERIDLTQEYAAAGTPRMFLSTVSSLQKGTYSFAYNLDGYTLPAPDYLGYDHWGFWNGKPHSDVKDHLNYTVEGDPVDALYGQMADNQKEADARYAACGALKKITYPTGGETLIDYEGNTVGSRVQNDHSFLDCSIYSVGGIRVKQMTDLDGTGRADTTRFFYSSVLGAGTTSGVLMQMPRHALDTKFTYEANYQEAGMPNGYTGRYLIYVHSITYSNKGYFNASRDSHIAYRHVNVVHPDGSRTAYEFRMDGDMTGGGLSMGKHVFADTFGTTFNLMSTDDIGPLILNDKKNMRGKPDRIRIYDASDKLIKSTSYYYDTDVVTIASMLFNEPEHYTRSSYYATSPLLVQTQETDYYYAPSGTLSGTMVRKERTGYNASLQPRSKWMETACDTLRTYYRYNQETGLSSPSGCDRLLSDALETRMSGGKEYLVTAEHYDYYITDNPHPTRITRYDVGEGIDVTGLNFDALFASARSNPAVQYNFQYDDKFRLTRASFPGGAWISYTWDGNHIASKTENGTSNQTLYSWKDLIGLTGISAPSGQTESYEYDVHNRPWKTLDTDGNAVSVMHYHLQNDQ